MSRLNPSPDLLLLLLLLTVCHFWRLLWNPGTIMISQYWFNKTKQHTSLARHWGSPGTVTILQYRFNKSTSCHISCLPLLSCLSLPYICGLGLCPFSRLVCDLLLIGVRGHLMEGHHSPGATFLGSYRDLITGSFQPRGWMQPTNIVNYFYPRVGLKLGWQRSWTVYWVLRDWSSAHHPLRPPCTHLRETLCQSCLLFTVTVTPKLGVCQ